MALSVPFSALRLLAGLATMAAIVLQPLIPPKVFTLRPNPAISSALYGHQHANDKPSAYWIDEQQQYFHCNYLPTDLYSCGYTLAFGADPTRGVDLTDYEGLQLKVVYKGDAPRLRIFMRNYNPQFDSSPDPGISSKFMSVAIRTADLQDATYVKMNEFSVGEWWIRDFDVPRVHSAPEFTNVTSLGIDFIFPGRNEVHVQEVVLVGAWIKKETLYLLIIAVWLLLIAWEGLYKIVAIYRKSTLVSERIDRLMSDYKNLEMEKREYETRSVTDVLTGVMNRAGAQQVLKHLFDGDQSRFIGILLLDVDHFKAVNDQLGHDAGDRVLQDVARLLGETTRATDVFGRWGGEEFILICPHLPADSLVTLAEKIRLRVSDHVFEAGPSPLHLSMSIGATLAMASESIDEVLKRADLALYEAKNTGRNQVVFKPYKD
jgi:diguanylate cyclase (GGDEF)-like protein